MKTEEKDNRQADKPANNVIELFLKKDSSRAKF